MSNNWKTIPEVGMGATLHIGSDAYPYTILDVSDDVKVYSTPGPYSGKWDRLTNTTTYTYEDIAWPTWIVVVPEKTYQKNDEGKNELLIEMRNEKQEKYIFKNGVYHEANKVFDPITKKYKYSNTTSIKNRIIRIGERKDYRDPSF